ncbi:MAG: ATP-binding protein, partial [Bdellovibrionaceae bacterium]|nr:ATP-binding protein [Pseudobdellovibrionaceae bacterium]
MILYSFVRNSMGLSPVQVEVILQKGIPKIEILGLPDRGLQESLVRIQAAIVNQGFEFPKAHKVVVNVRPIETKKSSLGLELSIALAILHLTDQKKLPQEKSFYVYGELSLAGEVQVPKDLELIPLLDKELITGPVKKEFTPNAVDFYSLASLQGEYARQAGSGAVVNFERPQLPQLKLSAATARLLEIVSVGEHSLLLAGPSGTGKTTFTQQLLAFLREPTLEEWWEIRRIGKIFDEERKWRP